MLYYGAAVSDEPAYDHDIMHGTIPELAAKATWADRDVYISGPDRLIHHDLDPKADQGL